MTAPYSKEPEFGTVPQPEAPRYDYHEPTYRESDGATQAPSPEDRSYQRYREEDRSLGEIASDVMDNATTLVKQEVALAKAEAQQSAKKAGKGAGMFAGAAVAGLMALIGLTLGIWWWLSVLVGSPDDPALGLGGLLTFVLWAIVAAILGVVGKSAFDKMNGLDQTTETVKKIPNAATGNEEKNHD